MIVKNDQNWMLANRSYLMASLQIVKEELDFYHKHKVKLKGENNVIFTPSAASKKALATAEKKLVSPSALEIITNAFHLSSFEQKILLLCAGVELLDDFGIMISELQGHSDLVHPSFNLANAVFLDAHWSAISPSSPLRYWNLIQIKTGTLIAKSPLIIEESILHYLTGFQNLSEPLRSILKPFPAFEDLVPSQQDLVNQILHILSFSNQNQQKAIIQLSSSENSDQLAVVAQTAQKLNKQLYQIGIEAIPAKQEERNRLAKRWNREALLSPYALYLDCSGIDEGDRSAISRVLSFIDQIGSLVFAGNGKWISGLNRSVHSYTVANPNTNEQEGLWKKYLKKEAKYTKDYLHQIVAHFNLSAGSIKTITTEVMQLHHNKVRVTKTHRENLKRNIWKIVCKHTRPKVEHLAQRIEPIATWEDIVLSDSQRETLKEIANQVKNRSKVYKEWGFDEKSTRGFGITALFSGASGTGKTMASEVLANELQLDLYRIDLSQVINKYIGETEKNLKRIFDAADAGGAILLFDEADALFGKRSEVKDSHDRYSNIEVSYLLQRMETYRGLAILTTNMKNALDTAFLRRIRFVIDFARPDLKLRAKIWKGIFPAHTPLDENLDLEKLARLNIPGGNIRNIALNAAFLAAEEDTPVMMSHILRAARGEYNKLEKTLTRNEIEGWA